MEWCWKQPKIELHAHLNGSIRQSTLLELAILVGENPADVENAIHKNGRTLVECFKVFDLIHLLTTDHATVTRITKEVVQDFASENIVYLELRTTPKNNAAKGMTKRSYMDAVINGLRAVETVDVSFIPSETESAIRTGRKHIYVRLLLSIDRRESTAAAMETVKLALELRNSGVVGIDLSGNPLAGDWDTFSRPLHFAKEQGLPVTLHCGEVKNQKEVQAMLDFLPQRIGHAIFLEEQQWEQLKASKIPVEICLTSNLWTESVACIHNHHFRHLYDSKHPIALCTDDAGIFCTTLSREHKLAASAFGLGEKELFNFSKGSVEYVFADEVVKTCLRGIFDYTASKLMLHD